MESLSIILSRKDNPNFPRDISQLIEKVLIHSRLRSADDQPLTKYTVVHIESICVFVLVNNYVCTFLRACMYVNRY